MSQSQLLQHNSPMCSSMRSALGPGARLQIVVILLKDGLLLLSLAALLLFLILPAARLARRGAVAPLRAPAGAGASGGPAGTAARARLAVLIPSRPVQSVKALKEVGTCTTHRVKCSDTSGTLACHRTSYGLKSMVAGRSYKPVGVRLVVCC